MFQTNVVPCSLGLALLLVACGDTAPIEDGAEGTLGVNGGTISGLGVTVTVPAGALSEDTQIALAFAQPAASLPAGRGNSGGNSAYAFTPHGQTFAVPVTLEIPYRQGPFGPPELYRLDDESDQTWERVDNAVFTDGTVRVQTDHFSIYLVLSPVDGNPDSDAGVPSVVTNPDDFVSDCGAGCRFEVPLGILEGRSGEWVDCGSVSNPSEFDPAAFDFATMCSGEASTPYAADAQAELFVDGEALYFDGFGICYRETHGAGSTDVQLATFCSGDLVFLTESSRLAERGNTLYRYFIERSQDGSVADVRVSTLLANTDLPQFEAGCDADETADDFVCPGRTLDFPAVGTTALDEQFRGAWLDCGAYVAAGSSTEALATACAESLSRFDENSGRSPIVVVGAQSWDEFEVGPTSEPEPFCSAAGGDASGAAVAIVGCGEQAGETFVSGGRIPVSVVQGAGVRYLLLEDDGDGGQSVHVSVDAARVVNPCGDAAPRTCPNTF